MSDDRRKALAEVYDCLPDLRRKMEGVVADMVVGGRNGNSPRRRGAFHSIVESIHYESRPDKYIKLACNGG